MHQTHVIAQHMGYEFISSFTKQLDGVCNIDVEEASCGTLLCNSKIYVCSQTTKIILKNSQYLFEKECSSKAQYNPDINRLFSSVAQLNSNLKILGVILTGIGDDGVLGCEELSGEATCITSDEKSSVVYGMPAQAAKRVKNIKIESLDEIVSTINKFGENSV
ncbi:MAG: chemotaxis protein CheB [Campylobacterota bacterium]|nr:chemotaxis protein CheB [Campylobacterota bacterium]